VNERSAFVSRVDLDGEDGCAWVHVRCKVSVVDARRLAKLMLVDGYPVRVLFPETSLLATSKNEDR
jgi:hypothetical protein